MSRRRRPGEFVPGQEPVGFPAANNREAELSYLARRKGRIPTAEALPPADAGRRGDLLVILGGAGVADTFYVCLKAAGGTYSWRLVATG